MPRCGCQDACSCLLVAGPGVNVDGLGTVDRPYEISAESALLSENLVFDNVGNVDFSTAGLGVPTSPLRVSANAALKMTDLIDVQGTPVNGEVPVWVGDHWDFQTPAGGTGSGGSVTVAPPLTGDGTSGQPLGLDLTIGDGLLGEGISADPIRLDLHTGAGLLGKGTAADPVRFGGLYSGQAVNPTSFNLTTTSQFDVASLTVPVVSTSSVYLVTSTMDLQTLVATTATFLGYLNVAGSASGYAQIVWIPQSAAGAVVRGLYSQTYRVTGIPAGNQIFKSTCSCSVANQFRVSSSHSLLTVQQVA